MKDYIIIIPARFNSSRFPGKPLVDIKGKSMIRRVWDKCVLASNPEKVIVATDDHAIRKHCIDQGMLVEMTSSSCLTGTDRLYEVSKKIKTDIYLNIQGDEPLISPKDIRLVIEAAQRKPDEIFNAMCRITNKEDFFNYNIPKVVTRKDGKLLYMSRASIPTNKKGGFELGMKQVCIYAYPRKIINIFGQLDIKERLEQVEDLEILRLLENGYEISMLEVSGSSIAVDIPEDLDKVRPLIYD